MKHQICDSCEAFYVNGVLVHEVGCPDAWKDEIRECSFCGCEFEPEEKGQVLCSEDCAIAYYG